jgi:hypothetical protein
LEVGLETLESLPNPPFLVPASPFTTSCN